MPNPLGIFKVAKELYQTSLIIRTVYVSTSATQTFTTTATTTLGAAALEKRADVELPEGVPTWATGCSSVSGTAAVLRFSSACSCFYRTHSKNPITMPTTTQTISLTSSFSTTATTTETSFTPTPTEVYIKLSDVSRGQDEDTSALEGKYLKKNANGYDIVEKENADKFYARSVLYLGYDVGRIYLDTDAQTVQLASGQPQEGFDDYGLITGALRPFASGIRPLAFRYVHNDNYFNFAEDRVFGEIFNFVYVQDNEENVSPGKIYGFRTFLGDEAPNFDPWGVSLYLEEVAPPA